MEQKIVGFHKDAEQVWVADLQCGHKQHVRHDPPMVERSWVLSSEGRQSHLGTQLNCKRCDEVGQVVGHAVLNAAVEAVREAFHEAGIAGLCGEGQVELAIDRLKSIPVKDVAIEAITTATGEFGTLS